MITFQPKTKLRDERKHLKKRQQKEKIERGREMEGSSYLIHEKQCLYYEPKKWRFAGNLAASIL